MRFFNLILFFSLCAFHTQATLFDELFKIKDDVPPSLEDLFPDNVPVDFFGALEDYLEPVPRAQQEAELEPIPAIDNIPPLVEFEDEHYQQLNETHFKRLKEIIDTYYPHGHLSITMRYADMCNLKETEVEAFISSYIADIRERMAALDEDEGKGKEEEVIDIVTPEFAKITDAHAEHIRTLVTLYFPKGHYSEARKYAKKHNLKFSTVEGRVRQQVKKLKAERHIKTVVQSWTRKSILKVKRKQENQVSSAFVKKRGVIPPRKSAFGFGGLSESSERDIVISDSEESL